jgi:hypothetical protein
VTATTLGAQPIGLAGCRSSGGDAQERPATNPVAALPCARIPLLPSFSTPLLYPLLGPSSATVSPHRATTRLFGLVEGDDPGQSRANPARDWPGSVGKLTLWRATGSRWVAGAVVAGRPPTNSVGGLPPGSPGRRYRPCYAGWSDG